jgi:hypothetical protein
VNDSKRVELNLLDILEQSEEWVMQWCAGIRISSGVVGAFSVLY